MTLITMKVDELHVSKENCRIVKKKDILTLAANMEAVGLINPILINGTDLGTTKRGAEGYEILAGQRRWLAAKHLGWMHIECIAVDEVLDEQGRRELSLAENTQRVDLTPMQEAEAYEAMFTAGKSIEETCEHFGKSRRFIVQRHKLAKLPTALRKLIHKEEVDLETAALLCMAKPTFVTEWLRQFKAEDGNAPQGWGLKSMILNPKINVRHAIFDVDTYEGTITQDLFSQNYDGEWDDSAYFDDADVFWAAQMKAVNLRANEIGATIIKADNEKWNSWDYRDATEEDGDSLSFIQIRKDGSVQEYEGLIPKDAARTEMALDATETKPPQAELTKAMATALNAELAQATQAAIGKDFKTAMRYTLGELLSQFDTSIHADHPSFNDEASREGFFKQDRDKAHEQVAAMDWKDVQKTLTSITAASYDVLNRESLAPNAYGMGCQYGANAQGRFTTDHVAGIKNRRTLAHMLADMAMKGHDTDTIDRIVAGEGFVSKPKVVDMQTMVSAKMVELPDWQPVWMEFPPGSYQEIEANLKVEEAA